MHNASSGHGVNTTKQEFGNPNGLIDASISEIPNQFTSFMSPSNSSSNLNASQIGNVDNVSSVVSMLKGTLERKKLSNQIEKESAEDHCLGYYGDQEVVGNSRLNQVQDYHIYGTEGTFQDASTVLQVNQGIVQTVQGSINIDLREFVTPTNPIQMSTLSREPSQSESSAAAPISAGVDACDGPSNSGQTQSNCDNFRQQVGNRKSSENGSRAKGTSKMHNLTCIYSIRTFFLQGYHTFIR